MRILALFAAATLAAAPIHAGPAEALRADIAVAEEQSGGVLGVAAIDPASNRRFSHRGDTAFPMASTYKIAIAGAVLQKVEDGKLALDTLLDVPDAMKLDGDIIATRLKHPGVRLSVANLLELMLTESDNTATDVMMQAAGGPAAVSAWVAVQGIKGQRIDRATADLTRDFFDLGPGPIVELVADAKRRDPAMLERLGAAHPPYDDGIKDTSTPDAMADLMVRIAEGKALSPKSTTLLLDIMGRCRTGAARIKGMMPKGTAVAHKTGTGGGSANDVGIITLPDGRKLIVALFVKKSRHPYPVRERAIADVARSLRDYFLFSTAD
jgi:beta-lactamase class A